MKEGSQHSADHSDVIKEIESAFAELPIPGRGEIITNLYWAGRLDIERRDTIEGLAEKKWQDLDRDAVVRYATALPTLTPEAFRYYIPAFLIDVVHESGRLDHSLPVSDTVVPMLVSRIAGKEDPLLVERTRCFNRSQSQAVYNFLVYRIPTSLEERDLTPEQASQALVFWRAKTEQAGD